MKLGDAVVKDVLPLDREHAHVLPKPTWPAPPEDRLDTRYFISAPDSLHLEAHVAGNQSYKIQETPIRYATKYRLSFWYLIAPGTELVDLVTGHAALSDEERDIVEDVFSAGDLVLHEIMVPRTEVDFLDVGLTLAEAKSIAIRTAHSRQLERRERKLGYTTWARKR